MAREQGFPVQLIVLINNEEFHPYLLELHDGGYLTGEVVNNSIGTENVFLNLRISIAGEEYLETLLSDNWWGRFKVKGSELFWIALTSAITSIITTVITLYLFKQKP